MAILATSSCEDSLDITPKGKTILDTVDDLELLLNQEFSFNTNPAVDLGLVTNEIVAMYETVPSTMSNRNSLSYAYLAYDETVNRAELATTDDRYATLYSMINYMNVIIEKLDDARGDETQKVRVEAEAHMLRAYFHYLLVNIYAGQYDPANASSLGGIAYVDNTNSGEIKQKLTVAQVYDRILQDCDESYVSSLYDKHANSSRIDKAFGYAVRAKVFFQMKNYEEAASQALKAIEINGRVEDRSTCKDFGSWMLSSDAPNQYFHALAGMRLCPAMITISREMSTMFEPGDYVKDFTSGWSEIMGQMRGGLTETVCYTDFGAQQNVYGLRAEQMYYIAGESYIRLGEIRKGLDYIDRVRVKRIDSFTSYTSMYDQAAMSEAEAMALLQKAKRIEFIGSYDTFFDCKRWNSETAYRHSITKDLGDYGTFTISPDSPLWIMPFPANATRFNPTLTQNY